MVNQLSPDLRIPSFRRVSELSPSCSIPYKLPIFYPLSFDIHASDGGCRGFLSFYSHPDVQTLRRSDLQTFLCPTSHLSRRHASSVLLEPTFPSNKLAAGHRSFFSLHGRV